MTKIKCDLSGLPLLGIHFMGRVTDVITPARTADSQAVSLDMEAGNKLIELTRRFKEQFRNEIAARDDIMRGPDPVTEFTRRSLQSDKAMLHLLFQLMAEAQKYVEPTGLSLNDQLLWYRAAEFADKVLLWSNKNGMPGDHGLPTFRLCQKCGTFYARFSDRGAVKSRRHCQNCGKRTNHVFLEMRLFVGGGRP